MSEFVQWLTALGSGDQTGSPPGISDCRLRRCDMGRQGCRVVGFHVETRATGPFFFDDNFQSYYADIGQLVCSAGIEKGVISATC